MGMLYMPARGAVADAVLGYSPGGDRRRPARSDALDLPALPRGARCRAARTRGARVPAPRVPRARPCRGARLWRRGTLAGGAALRQARGLAAAAPDRGGAGLSERLRDLP